MTHGAMLVCDFSLLPFGPWLFQDLLKSCTILSLYTTKKKCLESGLFFVLGCIATQRSAPATELGRAGHAPGRGRGVSGAWPGRGKDS